MSLPAPNRCMNNWLISLQNLIQFHAGMNRTHLLPKDTGISTFYNTYHSETLPFASKRRLVSTHAEAIDAMAIEAEAKMDKLKERIMLDERKVERNYQELELVKQDVEQECQRLLNDREVDSLAKARRETVKDAFQQCKTKNASLSQRVAQEVGVLREGLSACEREVQREKQDREGSMVRLIDEFQAEMLALERQLKQIRSAEEEVFQQMEVDIYNLQQTYSGKVDGETESRKREHETIIKLIGQCIENYRFIC